MSDEAKKETGASTLENQAPAKALEPNALEPYKAPLSAETEALLDAIRDAYKAGAVVKAVILLDRRNGDKVVVRELPIEPGAEPEALAKRIGHVLTVNARNSNVDQNFRVVFLNEKSECVSTHFALTEGNAVTGAGRMLPVGSNGFDVQVATMAMNERLLLAIDALLRTGHAKDALTFNELYRNNVELRKENTELRQREKNVIDAYWRLVGEAADIELKQARGRMHLQAEQVVFAQAGQILPLLIDKIAVKLGKKKTPIIDQLRAFHASLKPEQLQKIWPLLGQIHAVLDASQQMVIGAFLKELMPPQDTTIKEDGANHQREPAPAPEENPAQ